MPEDLPEDLDDLSGAQGPENSVEPEQELGQPSPTLGDQVADAQDKFGQGKGYRDRYRDWQAARAEKKAAKQGLKEGVEKKGAEAAKRKVATRATEEAGKQVLKKGAVTTGTKVVGGILAKQAVGSVVPVIGNIVMAIVSGLQLLWPAIKKVVPYVIYGVAGLLLLLAAAFGLLGVKTTPQYPSTQAQTDQTVLVASIGGDFVVSGRKITEKVLTAEKGRYRIVLNNVKTTNPERVVEVEQKVKEILLTIEGGINLSGEAKKKQLGQATSKIQTLDSTLPFGEWIARAAESQVGSQSLEFCSVTKASTNVACASFLTTVLQNAGVPNPIQAGVDGIWRRPFYRTIAARQKPPTEAYYGQNLAKLQRGDIIFWGDGRNDGGSVLFDHVGFYVGGGQAVDNSSGKKMILKRQAAKRDNSFRFFNGAKRYGKDL